MTRALALLLATIIWAACGPGPGPDPVSGPGPVTGPASNPGSGPSIRLAPERCPPDPVSGEGEPWGEAEHVRLAEGGVLELQGCRSEGEGWVTFRYDGPAAVSPFHLVELSLYEGGDWVLLSGRTGRRWTLGGVPVFSPDGAWMATAALDLDAGYERNHLDIWAVEEGSIRRALALEGGLEWGAKDVRWLSPTELEFTRVTWAGEPFGAQGTDSTRVRLRLRGGRWVEEPGPEGGD